MIRLTMLMAMMSGMLCMCACENLDDLTTTAQNEVAAATAGEPTSSGGDDISIGSISWLGDNFSSARISAKINSATIGSAVLTTDYNSYSWPSTTVKVKVDAICCLFYERGGQVVGGKFDWWRAGGQGSKILENVHHGYNGHSFPASGTPTYTMIVSVDGSQRSNIKRCDW